MPGRQRTTLRRGEGELQIAGKSQDLFVLLESGGTLTESEAQAVVMEWARAMRQMCVSVTDVFWVSSPGQVSGARGINKNPVQGNARLC